VSGCPESSTEAAATGGSAVALVLRGRDVSPESSTDAGGLSTLGRRSRDSRGEPRLRCGAGERRISLETDRRISLETDRRISLETDRRRRSRSSWLPDR
jgi:hypothetical protein